MNHRSLLATATLSLLVWTAAMAQNPTASITVNASASRRAIDPRIYGIAYGTTAQLNDLNVPLNRYGGNNTSRYNWQLNADNRGQDWYFESIPEASATPGERGNTFISTTQSGGARPMITIPMLDWVGKFGSNRSKLASFSQAKYGQQTANDWQQWPKRWLLSEGLMRHWPWYENVLPVYLPLYALTWRNHDRKRPAHVPKNWIGIRDSYAKEETKSSYRSD